MLDAAAQRAAKRAQRSAGDGTRSRTRGQERAATGNWRGRVRLCVRMQYVRNRACAGGDLISEEVSRTQKANKGEDL